MAPTTLHIINHTHWDREWFLTSAYTSRWIPRLIDRIAGLAARNAGYRYLLDGQTLVVEDLLQIAPDHERRVRDLIARDHLQIGPYYCQPDWQLSGGELLIRNLMLGQQDAEALGGRPMPAGWLVDTFGHIGQAPQIHRLFNIDAVYVWRGAPQLAPAFNWQGPDGSALLTVNLFGGYRNLYGVSHAPEVAAQRLRAEIRKLLPYYPTPDLPLFDGYDLEDNPEDPLTFFREHPGALPDDLRETVVLQEATPVTYARDVRARAWDLPTVHGELNSGKFGATFPGTLSARTYLKVMAGDCERLFFQLAEPLAAMAFLRGKAYDGAFYERWTRRLLQNAVHDCICGVSIDQVHEKMEDIYRRAHKALWRDVQSSLAAILSGFREGTYAVSTNPQEAVDWRVVDDRLVQARTGGVGVWPVGHGAPVTRVSEPLQEAFTWRNEHYEATLQKDGTMRLGRGRFGRFIVLEEEGDTYSTEPGRQLGTLQPTGPVTVVEKSGRHAVLRFEADWRKADREVTATVRLWFDPSPLLRWTIDLDSRGANLRVDMVFDGGGDLRGAARSLRGAASSLRVGMPFDVVQRPFADRDLLARDLPADLADVLLGQRELHEVRDFPFHDFVALDHGDGQGLAVLARGIRSYCAEEPGTIRLTLRRAVEWLTKRDLRNRAGDAGPFFYVPDARCERRVRHEIALVAGAAAGDPPALQRLNAVFQNPPLLVDARGGGERASWTVLDEPAPLSSLHVREQAVLARFYNPLDKTLDLSRPYRQVDVWGQETGQLETLAPRQIATARLPREPATAAPGEARVTLRSQPDWRVGPNRGAPDEAILAQLQAKIDALEGELEEVRAELARAQGAARHRLQHRVYVLHREQLEYRLSLLLNRRKQAAGTPPGDDYLYGVDGAIAEVGQKLNGLRIRRRIFDYVVQAL